MNFNDETGAPTPKSELQSASDRLSVNRDSDVLIGEKRLIMAFQSAPIGMSLIGPDFRFVRVNPAFCKMLGYSEEELLGRSFTDLTHPDDVRPNLKLAEDLFRGAIPSYRLEKRLVSKGGDLIWVDITSIGLRDVGDKPLHGLAIIEDITERKRAEDALRTSEERYRSFVVNSSEGIWRFETEVPIDTSLPVVKQKDLIFKHGYLAECNDAMARTYGFHRAEELIGARFGSLFEDDPGNEMSVMAFIKSGYRLQNVETVEQNINGETAYITTSVVGIVENGFLVRAWGTQRDETERRIAEKNLEASHLQLRALAAHLQSVRETERTQIAREIHDVLGQALTAIKIDLSWLKKNVATVGAEADPAEVRGRFEEAMELLDETLATVKTLSTELRPRVLDTFGLGAAMEWLCSDFHRRTGITFNCIVCEPGPVLSAEASTALFRILQESLTNVTRHAGASKVEVSLEQQNGHVQLRIQDNGVGITDKERSDPESLGLLGMQERAEMLGGTLNVMQAPEGGTVVVVQLPENA